MTTLSKYFSSLALAATLTFASAQDANAAPYITVNYPGGKTKDIDCATFYVEDGQLYLTQETMTELDINSQVLQGATSLRELSEDKKERMGQLARNLMIYVIHLSTQHGDTVYQTAMKEIAIEIAALKKAGKYTPAAEQKIKDSIDKKYTLLYPGKNWREMKESSLVDATGKAKKEMGLDKKHTHASQEPASAR